MSYAKSITLTLIGALHAGVASIRRRPLEAEVIFIAFVLAVSWLQKSDSPEKPESRFIGRIFISGEDLAVANLEETFAGFGYTLDKVRTDDIAVPRLIVSAVPGGLKDIRVIDRRKRLFFLTVLPLVLEVNEEIETDRQRLKRLSGVLDKQNPDDTVLDETDMAWINNVAERYSIDLTEEGMALIELMDVLKVRVAPIPTSLALAQAVEESAWGTSRFARDGNALFGQWVWNEDAGIVPKEQRDGQSYAVRAFETPLNSVRAYAKNLNTHWAYTNFREKRKDMLEKDVYLDGWALAETLTRYSERGPAYVKSLHAIMRVNRLRPLDKARLATPEAMSQMVDATSG